MESGSQRQIENPQVRRTFRTQLFVWSLAAFSLAVVLIVGMIFVARPAAPIQLALGDGRILQIEGVTYGVQHQMGKDSMLKRFRPWLPAALTRHLDLDRGANRIGMNQPGLVVWVNAIHAVGGTNVDCQGIRLEFVDRNGDLYGPSKASWFGGQNFWRVGHEFTCYPRDERELALRVTPWNGSQTNVVKFANPNPVKASEWAGGPLPQSKQVDQFELRLASLAVRTNGQGRKAPYETAARYFEPILEILQQGKPADGWSRPEWYAEVPNGNRGQFLGVHQPTLRFVTTVYPEATNKHAARLLAVLPQADLSTLTSNRWWNVTNSLGSNEVIVLGLFTRGTHTFSDGVYTNSSAMVSGPRGGAASGWTWSRRQVTPLRESSSHHHYTPAPMIYVNAGGLAPTAGRLAIRLRDDQGKVWAAKAQSASGGIQPFLVEVPPNVTNVVPELVLLKPVKAEFLVNTTNVAMP